MSLYLVAGVPFSDELYHHGIKGQKWGVRRYQNADGSYTAAGKERYSNKQSAKSQNERRLPTPKQREKMNQINEEYRAMALKSNDLYNEIVLPVFEVTNSQAELDKVYDEYLSRKEVKKAMSLWNKRKELYGTVYDLDKIHSTDDIKRMVAPEDYDAVYAMTIEYELTKNDN